MIFIGKAEEITLTLKKIIDAGYGNITAKWAVTLYLSRN